LVRLKRQEKSFVLDLEEKFKNLFLVSYIGKIMEKPLTLKKLCFYSQKRNLSEGKNLFFRRFFSFKKTLAFEDSGLR